MLLFILSKKYIFHIDKRYDGHVASSIDINDKLQVY